MLTVTTRQARIRGRRGPDDLPAIDLMHPTQVARPFHRAGWIYEEKYDGGRMLASKHGQRVGLVSHTGSPNVRCDAIAPRPSPLWLTLVA